MSYDIKRIQQESKQRYIDKGIYVEGCDISGIDAELQTQATKYVNHQVAEGKLANIGTQVCLDCGEQAEHYHHNVSYKREHWLNVIPLCQSCHFSLHNKIVSGTFYDFGLMKSVENFLLVDDNIGIKTLANLHNVSRNSISKVCYRNNLVTNFTIKRPTKESLSLLYKKFGSASAVGRQLNVSGSAVVGWLNNYSITLNENTYDKGVRLHLTDKELLNYIKQGYSQRRIGNIVEVDSSTIWKWITKLPKDKLTQAQKQGAHNKTIHTQIKQFKKKHWLPTEQAWVNKVVSEMEMELI